MRNADVAAITIIEEVLLFHLVGASVYNLLRKALIDHIVVESLQIHNHPLDLIDHSYVNKQNWNHPTASYSILAEMQKYLRQRTA